MSISIKMEDVAKEAKVSTATVSRVLNDYQYVSDEARKRVLEAINRLRYQPNKIARGLASRKTNLIGIIVPDMKYHYYASMLSTIEDHASKNNYNIIVCNVNENLEKETQYINILREMWVDGIILMHEKINKTIKEQLLECSIPIVLASIKLKGLNFPSVNIDDFQAAYDATRHLINSGHKKIAIISGNMRDYTAGYLRFKGYLQALKDNNIKFKKQYYTQANFNMEDGYQAMKKMMKLEDKPTAIFAVSDSMAVGAMNCAKDMDYHVPDDISIVGFDNIDLANAVRPRLTTVNQPVEKIGRVSIELLINLIKDKSKDKDVEIIIEHSIVTGATCRGIK